MLKPQDLLVLLKLSTSGDTDWTYASLAESTGLSASETHAAIKRATAARLFSELTRSPIRSSLLAFVLHGVPYVYHAERGAPTSRGLLTGFAARPLDGPRDYPFEARYVWPDPQGQDQGWTVTPLYPSVPVAARKDDALYALLALIDELRIGRARERARAADELRQRLA